MENFLFAFNTVLPFLLYIAFGYGVRMSGLADEDFMKRLNKDRKSTRLNSSHRN